MLELVVTEVSLPVPAAPLTVSSIVISAGTSVPTVTVTVAATILHFMHARSFPIFDFHVWRTLRKAGLWKRPVTDAGIGSWAEYVRIMRRLARRYRVSLRDLDKALYAYDRWGTRRRR